VVPVVVDGEPAEREVSRESRSLLLKLLSVIDASEVADEMLYYDRYSERPGREGREFIRNKSLWALAELEKLESALASSGLGEMEREEVRGYIERAKRVFTALARRPGSIDVGLKLAGLRYELDRKLGLRRYS